MWILLNILTYNINFTKKNLLTSHFFAEPWVCVFSFAHGGGGFVAVMSNSAAPWTVACQVPLPMGLFRQEYWSGWPFPSLGDIPSPGIDPWSPAWQEDSEPLVKLWI